VPHELAIHAEKAAEIGTRTNHKVGAIIHKMRRIRERESNPTCYVEI
jgi:hypothetical protein